MDGNEWVRDARDSLVRELRLYFRTLYLFMRNPVRFGRAWASGEEKAMNPLGFLGLCVLLRTPISFWRANFGMHGYWVEVQKALPWFDSSYVDFITTGSFYLMPIGLCVAIQPFARLLGSKRPLGVSVALSFFAAGPRMLLDWLKFPYDLRTLPHRDLVHDRHLALPDFAIFVAFGLFLAALVGAHGMRWWRTVLAFFLGALVSLIAFAAAVAAVEVWVLVISKH
jgi:hypothetical protein